MSVPVGNRIQSTAKFLASLVAMVSGITKNFTAKMSLTVGGVVMTQAAILAKLAGIQGMFDAVTKAKNAAAAAVKAKDDGLQDARQFLADLRKAIEAQFGSASPLLPDFGIPLPKPHKSPSAAEKATSTGLRMQTRKAHGIMGKKQRAAITVGGRPGVQLLGPDGKPMAGVETLGAPVPPAPIPGAGTTPAAGTAPAGSTAAGTPAPAQGGTPSGGTPGGSTSGQ